MSATAAPEASAGQQQAFSPETFFMNMPMPQMQALKAQFQKELSMLSESFAQLKTAQARFNGSMTSLSTIKPESKDQEMLVPLNSTLYVSGTLNNAEKVLIDIGTGYYVEKSISDAVEYFKGRIEFLAKQTEALQETIMAKRSQFEIFMDIYQMKMNRMSEAAAAGTSGKAAVSAK